MESFFATLKKEKIYRIAAYRLPRKQVRSIIFRYIFVYYNRITISSANSRGMPPAAYKEWAKAHSPTVARRRHATEFSPFRYAPLRKFSCLYHRLSSLRDFSTAHILTIPPYDKSFKPNKCTTLNYKTILPKNIDKYNTIIYNKNIKNQTENYHGNKVIFL